jgi:hypothetical protein
MSRFDPHSPFNDAQYTSPCTAGPYKPFRPWCEFDDAGARPAVEPGLGASELGLFSRLKAATIRALSAFGR